MTDASQEVALIPAMEAGSALSPPAPSWDTRPPPLAAAPRTAALGYDTFLDLDALDLSYRLSDENCSQHNNSCLNSSELWIFSNTTDADQHAYYFYEVRNNRVVYYFCEVRKT